jgi:hypothetical protein
MDVIRVLGEVRPLRLLRQARHQRWLKTHRDGDGRQVAVRPPIEVDPQQLALTDPLGQSRLEFDLAILAVGIVEADLEPAVALAGYGAQWRTASKTTTRTATNAVAYCSTSIDRSTCSPTGGSITPARGIRDSV